MKLVAVAIVVAAASAHAGPLPDVRIDVDPPENLADAADPIPGVAIFNDSKSPIEIDLFNGVPFTMLEGRNPSGNFERGTGLICGNGFVPHVIAPHTVEFFALWTRVAHGPRVSATYRVALPYTVLRGKHRIEREAISDPFDLAYGDVAPRDPKDAAHPGHVVVVSAERERNAPLTQPSPAALAAKLVPDADACVAAAQKRLPWLRGRFTLVVYQYVDPAATLFVGASLLGDEALNACLGALRVTDKIPTKFEMTFAVSPSTP